MRRELRERHLVHAQPRRVVGEQLGHMLQQLHGAIVDKMVKVLHAHRHDDVAEGVAQVIREPQLALVELRVLDDLPRLDEGHRQWRAMHAEDILWFDGVVVLDAAGRIRVAERALPLRLRVAVSSARAVHPDAALGEARGARSSSRRHGSDRRPRVLIIPAF